MKYLKMKKMHITILQHQIKKVKVQIKKLYLQNSYLFHITHARTPNSYF